MSERKRAREAVARLELLSHGSTTSWNSAGHAKPESRPPTGSGEADFRKFRRRLQNAASEADFKAIADDAEAVHYAATHTPDAADIDLDRTDSSGRYLFSFKRMVANSDEKISELARKYDLSRQSIYSWRAKYRTLTNERRAA